MKRKRHIQDHVAINTTPRLGSVCIMPIFFIVTTSFARERGLEVSRPSSVRPSTH